MEIGLEEMNKNDLWEELGRPSLFSMERALHELFDEQLVKTAGRTGPSRKGRLTSKGIKKAKKLKISM